MDISKIKEILKEILQTIQNNPEKYDSQDSIKLEHIMDLFTKIRKLREDEVALLFSESENFYLNQNFETSLNLLGFAETIVNNSGLYNWKERITILNHKITRSMEIFQKFKQFNDLVLSDLPIMQIHQHYNQLQLLFQELEEEKERLDSIHPEIQRDFRHLLDNFKEFMDKNGIRPQFTDDKKFVNILGTTKQSLDIKNKELKLNKFLNNAEKYLQNKSSVKLNQAKEELMKAYKLIQEYSSAFSLNQKKTVIELLDRVEKQTKQETQKIPEVISDVEILCDRFEFERALKLLDKHQQQHIEMGLTVEEEDFEEMRKKISDNLELFQMLQKIEELLEKNDLLSLKTQIIPFSQTYSQLKQNIKIFNPLKNRIEFIINSVQSNQNIGQLASKRPMGIKNMQPFNPLDDKEIGTKKNASSTSSSSKINKDELNNQGSAPLIPNREDEIEKREKFRKYQKSEEKERKPPDRSDFLAKFSTFSGILQEKGKISKIDLANALGIKEEELLPFLMECRKTLDFSLKGAIIYGKNSPKHPRLVESNSNAPNNPKTSNVNSDEKNNSNQERHEELSRENNKKTRINEDEDDLLDTLDDLLKEDI